MSSLDDLDDSHVRVREHADWGRELPRAGRRVEVCDAGNGYVMFFDGAGAWMQSDRVVDVEDYR